MAVTPPAIAEQQSLKELIEYQDMIKERTGGSLPTVKSYKSPAVSGKRRLWGLSEALSSVFLIFTDIIAIPMFLLSMNSVVACSPQQFSGIIILSR